MATQRCQGISALAPVHRVETLCDNNELRNSSPPPGQSWVLRNRPPSHQPRVGTGSRQVSAMTLALPPHEAMMKRRAFCQSTSASVFFHPPFFLFMQKDREEMKSWIKSLCWRTQQGGETVALIYKSQLWSHSSVTTEQRWMGNEQAHT